MIDNKALISVIVPVYNVEKYLVRCIESIIAQSYKNLEIILVDDGSPDNCGAICDEYASKHEKIRVIHKENGGLSSARRAGFLEANGEYIIFIDSDDYIDSDMIEKLLCSAQESNADMAICGYYTQFSDNITAHTLPYNKNLLAETEITEEYILPLIGYAKNKINLPGFLWIRLLKKPLIKEEFFVSENRFFAEDIVFDLLYSDSIKKIAVVNLPLYRYCINGQSLSNKYRKNKWQMLKNLYDFKSEFLAKRNISGGNERLNNFLSSSLLSAVDNAVLSGSYSSYLEEIKFLTKTEKNTVKSAIKAPSSKTVALTLFLLKHKFYFILYSLRKSRLKK